MCWLQTALSHFVTNCPLCWSVSSLICPKPCPSTWPPLLHVEKSFLLQENQNWLLHHPNACSCWDHVRNMFRTCYEHATNMLRTCYEHVMIMFWSLCLLCFDLDWGKNTYALQNWNHQLRKCKSEVSTLRFLTLIALFTLHFISVLLYYHLFFF